MTYGHATIEAAKAALADMIEDTEADNPGSTEDPSVYYDLVHSVVFECAPEVAAELLRREGLGDLD
jgi:hypothetical protein